MAQNKATTNNGCMELQWVLDRCKRETVEDNGHTYYYFLEVWPGGIIRLGYEREVS